VRSILPSSPLLAGRNDGDTGNGIETPGSGLRNIVGSTTVGMMEIPETGLRPDCVACKLPARVVIVGMMEIPETGLRLLLAIVSRRSLGDVVGMMEIPETGLRLSQYVAALARPVHYVGMMEIPETGLRWRGEGRFLARRSSVSDALLVLLLRAMAVSRKRLAAKGRAKSGDRGKGGIKRSVLVDADGIPLRSIGTPANRHHSLSLTETLYAVVETLDG
jgi:hypothetical protein